MNRSEKRIVMLDAERMRRIKTAMIVQAPTGDRFRIGDQWGVVSAESWNTGQAVDEVNHFNRHSTALGDVLIVERIDRVIVAHVQVTGIQMQHTDTLTDADIVALGYADRGEFMEDWGNAFAGRVWLMSIAHLTPQAQRADQVQ